MKIFQNFFAVHSPSRSSSRQTLVSDIVEGGPTMDSPSSQKYASPHSYEKMVEYWNEMMKKYETDHDGSFLTN